MDIDRNDNDKKETVIIDHGEGHTRSSAWPSILVALLLLLILFFIFGGGSLFGGGGASTPAPTSTQ